MAAEHSASPQHAVRDVLSMPSIAMRVHDAAGAESRVHTSSIASPHTDTHAHARSGAPGRAPQDVMLWQRAVSASFGALITSVVTMPLDVVKTRLQGEQVHTHTHTHSFTRAAACCPFYASCRATDASTLRSVCVHVKWSAAPASVAASPRTSAVGMLSRIVSTEGVRALWRGLTPSLLMAAPSTALYFSAYDEMKRRLERSGPNDMRARYAPLLAGVCGRVWTVLCVAPLELVRTRAMYASSASMPGGGGMLATLRSEISSGGVRSLWRGVVPTLWRDVPFSGVYWAMYEAVKARLTQVIVPEAVRAQGDERALASLPFSTAFGIAFASGASSGAVAATITTPFDVIKTRRQVQTYHVGRAAAPAVAGAGAALPLPVSTWALVHAVARDEGLAGLFAGLSSRVAKVAPSCAIMIASYEIGKRFFAKMDDSMLAAQAANME